MNLTICGPLSKLRDKGPDFDVDKGDCLCDHCVRCVQPNKFFMMYGFFVPLIFSPRNGVGGGVARQFLSLIIHGGGSPGPGPLRRPPPPPLEIGTKVPDHRRQRQFLPDVAKGKKVFSPYVSILNILGIFRRNQ